jgi:Protein of unknown function with PCYCGC motif
MQRTDLERRYFLAAGALFIGAGLFPSLLGCNRAPDNTDTHFYALAPESILPAEIQRAPQRIREAYRFAVGNRGYLQYIPCYCGCGADGHTSNASCYFTDSSTPENPVFDRMSLA